MSAKRAYLPLSELGTGILNMHKESRLVIEGAHFPRYSLRGCVQEIMPAQKSHAFKRTINGELVHLKENMDQKYISKISCTDESFPGISHLCQGNIVHIHSIISFSQPLVNGRCLLSRPPVLESIVVKDRSGKSITFDREESVLSVNAEEGTVSYRPILTMCITHFAYRFDEWENKAGWCIELEEV